MMSPEIEGLLFFGVIAAAVCAAVWVKRWFVEHRAESWNEVSGRVESGEVHGTYSVAAGRLPTHTVADFRAELKYSYKVDGEYYAGSLKQSFDDEQVAWDFVDGHKGKQILVRYKPEDPGKSVLWKVLGEV